MTTVGFIHHALCELAIVFKFVVYFVNSIDAMDIYEGDEPPQLIDAATELVSSEVVDKVGDNVKVPITIVTGRKFQNRK